MSRETGADQRLIGVSMAVAAALLAVVTLAGHRLHTEEVVLQTKAADQWAYYQAKSNRSHMYANDAALAEFTGAAAASKTAADWRRKGDEERQQADEVQREAQGLDAETEAAARKATFFDIGEICLEIGIVLSSIALLTRSALYWRLSFLPTLVGVVVAAYGLFR